MAGCARKEFEGKHEELAVKYQQLRDSVEKYALADYAWEQKLYQSICELEKAANIPVPKRLCPGGPGDGSGAPPKPPPFPE
jgi:hypothetical protein